MNTGKFGNVGREIETVSKQRKVMNKGMCNERTETDCGMTSDELTQVERGTVRVVSLFKQR